MEEIVLYSYFRSSTAYRARIALNLKGLEYKQIAVHLLEGGGQQHTPAYRAINPTGEVPSLIHNQRTLAQSFAIIEYLEECFPTPALLPKEPWAKAKVRQICENINSGIHPISNLKITQYLASEYSLTPEQVKTWQIHWISKGLAALEKIVAENIGQHAFGDEITFADIFIVPQLFSARRFGVETTNYPNLAKVEKAVASHPAFIKAHPHNQPDTPEDVKGKI